ncbi:hypothetical protein [Mucilaginibacter sp. 22184]|uniref:hypothetical protein n=1 Tax=Mucilaginibacter sp. 22184 TaxID=3453887 RepID=UPI003F85ECE2
MNTTNQDAVPTPNDGGDKLNQDTPQDTNNSGSSPQNAENAPEEQGKELPHILKPEEEYHSILRGVNK